MANVSKKPKNEADPETAAVDPKVPRLHSVHLPENTTGPRRRVIDLGPRGKFLFNADVTGKESKKLPGYPHHRMKLTAREAAQFAGDGFKVRALSDNEIAEAAAPSAAAAALTSAVASMRPQVEG
jgi:hypothetical protein